MPTQLDLVRATSKTPLYERIDFAEFDPALTGSIRVRVNPSRGLRRELDAAFKERERLDQQIEMAEDEDKPALQAERDAVGTRFNAFVAQLIPRADDDNTPTTPEEFDQFLEGDADDDTAFQQWIIAQIWERVFRHFLAPTRSRNNSTVGDTPSTNGQKP